MITNITYKRRVYPANRGIRKYTKFFTFLQVFTRLKGFFIRGIFVVFFAYVVTLM
ncbi:MAG: hypothetical protein FWC08_13810 [Defluviitaleaceae bacterium]|nr:hypothetical protein [Defluviitaleaceae bacterium]